MDTEGKSTEDLTEQIMEVVYRETREAAKMGMVTALNSVAELADRQQITGDQLRRLARHIEKLDAGEPITSNVIQGQFGPGSRKA